MDHRYSDEFDAGERVPLGYPDGQFLQQSPPRQHHNQYHHNSQTQYYHDEPSPSRPNPRQTSPGRSTYRPGIHPDSEFARLREQRRRSRGYEAAAATGAGAGVIADEAYTAEQSSRDAPQPPPHRGNSGRSGWSRDQAYVSGVSSIITPGIDNFGEAASGGLAGIASTIAERNARESGLEAMRGTEDYHNGQRGSPYDQSHYDYNQGYGNEREESQAAHGQYHESSSRLTPLGMAAVSSGTLARSQHSYSSGDPFDDPRYAYGARVDPALGQVDPNDIMDDGDDGLNYQRPAGNSMLSLGNGSERGNGSAGAAGAAGGAAAGGVIGGLLGKNRNNYGPVHNSAGYQGGGASEYDLDAAGAKEQSQWAKKQSGKKKTWRWVIIVAVGLIIAGAIAGGIVAGIYKNKSDSSSSGESASDDESQNGDLNINSSEIQALLNNKDLHKVFPGIDYTPINTQYPDCLGDPPSQNNITRDVAVLSQLTNKIRLYGTDCNQTEMVIHAISQLNMTADIKIWLGVWQDNNVTTNARQLAQMWTILDNYGTAPFEGLIIANEILYREQMTVTQLGDLMSSVRTNMSAKGLDVLPVATSDLGVSWTSELAEASDLIMANIHPFFGGVPAASGAAWAYNFWESQNGPFFKTNTSANVIAEIGWPSQGGTDCGTTAVTSCANGAVAAVDGMNTLMNDWVCQALENGTNYFWFEAFDEPWKILYDSGDENWEDHWGLMDVNRNLKSGVTIPDCGGKTVS